MERLDFRYEISDERLIAYGRIPVLDRLKWLDDVRRFTLMVRNAPLARANAATGGGDSAGDGADKRNC